MRASDDDGSSAADTGEPPADAPPGQSSESSPLTSGAATPLSAPGLPAAANGFGAGPVGCPSPKGFPDPEGLLGDEGGLGGAASRRTLSMQLGLGAYQRSQEDIAWVPGASAWRARPEPPLEAALPAHSTITEKCMAIFVLYLFLICSRYLWRRLGAARQWQLCNQSSLSLRDICCFAC